jgi:hypothetical protein
LPIQAVKETGAKKAEIRAKTIKNIKGIKAGWFILALSLSKTIKASKETRIKITYRGA